jgi:hypothetical protein
MNKFKIGDWVKTPNDIFQIEDVDDHDYLEGIVDDIQLHFTDSHSQWEIRQVAESTKELIK